jgi:hypothetical protein
MSSYEEKSLSAIKYEELTGKDAYELVQIFNGKRIWYNTKEYVEWLEGEKI